MTEDRIEGLLQVQRSIIETPDIYGCMDVWNSGSCLQHPCTACLSRSMYTGLRGRSFTRSTQHNGRRAMAERPALHVTLQPLALLFMASSTASVGNDLLLPQMSNSDRHLLAEILGISGCRLSQDSAVCGFNEYFCGEAAFILHCMQFRKYNAVSDGEVLTIQV